MATTHQRRPLPGPLAGLHRREDEGIVAGVAAGIGHHLSVDPVVVRLALVLLALASGTGVILYIVAWVVLPTSPSSSGAPSVSSRGLEQAVAVGLLTVGSLLLLRNLGVWFPETLVWPAAVVAVGLGFVWARTDAGDGAGWRLRAARLPGDPFDPANRGRALVLRLVAGVVLLFLGLGTFVATNDRFAAAGRLLMAVLAVAVGVGLLLGPWILRLFRELGQERRERIRSEERAEMAAHLHDSVLQTLALIQRRADSPHETVALARRQERELRAWLFGEGGLVDSGVTLSAALREVVDDVEADYPVTVDLVLVGEAAVGDHIRALVLAIREAVVNAAKHAAVAEVSLYVEVEPRRVLAFVRDRGSGFDPEAAGDGDERGVRESIVGRVERHGGRATLSSVIGEGTEVAFEMPRDPAARE